MYDHIWNYLYYPSPQSVQDSTDTPNTSTYTAAQYLARPSQNWGGKGVVQFNQIQGPSNGTTTGVNYGSDYFMDAYGYMVGFAPTISPSEPQSYGAGKWVNGQYVAQPITFIPPTRVPV